MTYQEFVATIFRPVSYFVEWLKMVADSLMENYIFITFLNLTMAISLIFLFINSILFVLNKIMNRNLDYIEKKQNYELYKNVQHDYLINHRNDEFDYLYDINILKQQVINRMYESHPDVLLDNKIQNIKLNSEVIQKMKLESFHKELKKENDNKINSIMYENKEFLKSRNLGYDEKNNQFYRLDTGEVVKL